MADRPAGIGSTGKQGEPPIVGSGGSRAGPNFVTINLLERRANLLVLYIGALREAVRRSRRERPCYRDGWVVLTEPLHCISTLPEGDDDSRAVRGIYPIPSVFRLRRIA
jgi:putative transposase